MKMKILMVIAALVCVASARCHAQTYALAPVAATTQIPATASNVYIIPLPRAREFSLYFQWNLTGAGTAINRGVLDTSNDGVNWKLAVGQWDMTANGATPILWHTNITANAIPYYRLTLHNSNSVPVTNIILSAVAKPDL